MPATLNRSAAARAPFAPVGQASQRPRIPRRHTAFRAQERDVDKPVADEGWVSAAEKEGSNPMKDPVGILGLFGLLFPFLLLGILLGTGVIDLGAGKP